MSRTLANPKPPTSDNISFLPYPSLKGDFIYVSTLVLWCFPFVNCLSILQIKNEIKH